MTDDDRLFNLYVLKAHMKAQYDRGDWDDDMDSEYQHVTDMIKILTEKGNKQ